MEIDRYQQNSKLFITCMLSMIVSLTLLAFSLYLFLPLIIGWQLHLPEFIYMSREWLKSSYSITEFKAGIFLFLFIFIPALFFGFIAYLTSNMIENQIYGIEPPEQTEHHALTEDLKETASVSLKLISTIILVLSAVFFLEWLLTSSPPAPIY